MYKVINKLLFVLVVFFTYRLQASENLETDTSINKKFQHMALENTITAEQANELRNKAYQHEYDSSLGSPEERSKLRTLAFETWNQLALAGDTFAQERLAAYFAEGIEDVMDKDLYKAGLLFLNSYIGGNYMLYEHLKGTNAELITLAEDIKSCSGEQRKQLARKFANLYAEAHL